jgi:hypothetical protein
MQTAPVARLYIQSHKRFPLNFESDWAIPCAFEKNIDMGGPYLCQGDFSPNLESLLPPNEQGDEFRTGYLGQTICAEHWILHHLRDVDYVGVTGYRRYPHFAANPREHVPSYQTEPTLEAVKALTGPAALARALEVLKVYDVITVCREHKPWTMGEQYLGEKQIAEIWWLFLECVAAVAPEYKKHMAWFDMNHHHIFCGPMGLTPIGMFREYADIYLQIITLICNNVEQPFRITDPNHTSKSDRWIGYLAERFYPYFLFVNRVNAYEVPMVLLK